MGILKKFASLVFATSMAFCVEFTVMTEEYPPYNYTENGVLKGIATDTVKEILLKIKHPEMIEVLPWSRAYSLIQRQDNMVLFSMTRTESREQLFKWVGPVAENNWVFFAKKGSGVKISSMGDAKKVNAIGTYKDDAGELMLKELGFTNIDSVIRDELNVKKLEQDKIQLWISGDVQGYIKAKEFKLQDSIEPVYNIKSMQLYIAFSKNTPDDEVKKWQAALDELKKDGTYQKIVDKYKK